MKDKEYAKDSTRGGAILDPLNYKGDVLTQAWIDARLLDTISNWLIKKGYYPRSLADVVRRPIEVLVAHLVEVKEIEMTETTAEARESLKLRYRVNLSRGDRGGKNLLHNQILSGRREELGDKVALGQRTNDVQRPVLPGREIDEMEKERLRKIYEDLGDNDALARARTEMENMEARGEIAPSKVDE